ncbi:hypothetical protein PoB_007034300 [Plakobranchus ocellatus]|uniref:Uncharacterized protein n=1 Tax=Plakobranchus ocellatus TaxID=259542 RepID=A0AAV4DIG6_9GAST|nr:hypothetical protein PoB_007034300 [Plakobranchus ocellatus]
MLAEASARAGYSLWMYGSILSTLQASLIRVRGKLVVRSQPKVQLSGPIMFNFPTDGGKKPPQSVTVTFNPDLSPDRPKASSLFLRARLTVNLSPNHRQGPQIHVYLDLRRRQNRKKGEGFPRSQIRIASPQQGDLRLLGPSSGQGACGGALTRKRRVLADLRADSLSTVPPTPFRYARVWQIEIDSFSCDCELAVLEPLFSVITKAWGLLTVARDPIERRVLTPGLTLPADLTRFNFATCALCNKGWPR